MNCEVQVVCHLPRSEKAAIADLAHARRTTVSKLVRSILIREAQAAARSAQRAKKAAA